MSAALVFTDQKCFDYIKQLFPDEVECTLLDLEGPHDICIANDCILFAQEGVELRLSDYQSVLWLPGSIERFLLGNLDDHRPSEISLRSGLALRLSLVAELSCNSSGSTQCWGNRPIDTLTASNRAAFFRARQRYFDARFTVASSGAILWSSAGRFRRPILRFLPDTHIWIGGKTTTPRLLAPSEIENLSRIDFPVCLEEHLELPYDLRVFVFGPNVLAIAWRRSSDEQVVDVRSIFKEINAFVLMTLPEEVSSFIRYIGAAFRLKLFCVDYVSDLEASYFPVDLNISPSWHWLSQPSRDVVDQAFTNFLKCQL